MTPEERTLLDDLFQRLRQAEGQPRDPDAERFIRDAMQAQPAAPYYMAQSLLVQQHALSAAQQRIEELERQLRDAQQRAPSSGGIGSFLGNAFGRREEPRPAPQPVPQPVPQPAPQRSGPWGAPAQPAYPPQPQRGFGPAAGPWGGAPGAPGGYPGAPGYAPQPGRGSFMGGALQTAAGVAGGMLAVSAISSLLHSGGSPFGAADASHTPASHTPTDTGDPVIHNDQGFPPPETHNTGYQDAAHQPDDTTDYTADDGDFGGGGDDDWA